LAELALPELLELFDVEDLLLPEVPTSPLLLFIVDEPEPDVPDVLEPVVPLPWASV
jgi:hypothetical protein